MCVVAPAHQLRSRCAALVLSLITSASLACGGGPPAEAPPSAAAPAPGTVPASTTTLEGDGEPSTPAAYEAALPEGLRRVVAQPFTGDLDQMVQRRLIRVGVTYNRTFYFADKGVQRGAAYEFARAFEDWLNQQLKSGNAKVNVAVMPMQRDALGRALLEGTIDLAVAQVTVRPELQARVDFTNPTRTNVSEVVVTGPRGPAIASVEDLSGRQVFARRDSSAHASLLALNSRLEAGGKAPVIIEEVPGNLEDDDLLEMVNAGLIPTIVVQDYLASFWKQIFTDLRVHDTVALRTGAALAVPIRKNSPLLKAELNTFIAKFGLGTMFGNMMEKRYLASTSFVKRAGSDAERRKFLALTRYFRTYGDQYGVDYLLMAAQGYQESQLDQDAKSQVGAIGVMQLMPATGKEMAVGDIRQTEANIHAGVKYMRFMLDQYYKDEPMEQLDKVLFTFASYNAGPGRIRQLRREAEKRGLNPNVWFGNVEQIASERVGRETVTYVSNIYKYFIAYKLIAEDRARREAAKAAVTASSR